MVRKDWQHGKTAKLKTNRMNIIKRLFGKKKKYLIDVFEDKYGKLYGGTIHDENSRTVVSHVSHIESPKYLGKFEIWIKQR